MIRNIPALHQSARRGYWDRYVGEEIQGKTVGLLGFGNIAQMTAKKLQGFDVKLIAYDKYPNADKAKEYGVELVSSDDVLKRSDVVSMHLPSLKETYHMMSDEQFSMMKKNRVFRKYGSGCACR